MRSAVVLPFFDNNGKGTSRIRPPDSLPPKPDDLVSKKGSPVPSASSSARPSSGRRNFEARLLWLS
jgi:hypothetical protein